MMAERAIERSWVERTVLAPDQTEPDPSHSDMVRAFRAVPERDGRVLRAWYTGERIPIFVSSRRFWTEGAGHENDI